jgi:hypothetical protein
MAAQIARFGSRSCWSIEFFRAAETKEEAPRPTVIAKPRALVAGNVLTAYADAIPMKTSAVKVIERAAQV